MALPRKIDDLYENFILYALMNQFKTVIVHHDSESNAFIVGLDENKFKYPLPVRADDTKTLEQLRACCEVPINGADLVKKLGYGSFEQKTLFDWKDDYQQYIQSLYQEHMQRSAGNKQLLDHLFQLQNDLLTTRNALDAEKKKNEDMIAERTGILQSHEAAAKNNEARMTAFTNEVERLKAIINEQAGQLDAAKVTADEMARRETEAKKAAEDEKIARELAKQAAEKAEQEAEAKRIAEDKRNRLRKERSDRHREQRREAAKQRADDAAAQKTRKMAEKEAQEAARRAEEAARRAEEAERKAEEDAAREAAEAAKRAAEERSKAAEPEPDVAAGASDDISEDEARTDTVKKPDKKRKKRKKRKKKEAVAERQWITCSAGEFDFRAPVDGILPTVDSAYLESVRRSDEYKSFSQLTTTEECISQFIAMLLNNDKQARAFYFLINQDYPTRDISAEYTFRTKDVDDEQFDEMDCDEHVIYVKLAKDGLKVKFRTANSAIMLRCISADELGIKSFTKWSPDLRQRVLTFLSEKKFFMYAEPKARILLNFLLKKAGVIPDVDLAKATDDANNTSIIAQPLIFLHKTLQDDNKPSIDLQRLSKIYRVYANAVKSLFKKADPLTYIFSDTDDSTLLEEKLSQSENHRDLLFNVVKYRAEKILHYLLTKTSFYLLDSLINAKKSGLTLEEYADDRWPEVAKLIREKSKKIEEAPRIVTETAGDLTKFIENISTYSQVDVNDLQAYAELAAFNDDSCSDILQYTLKLGADVNKPDDEGDYLIHRTAGNGFFHSTNVLIEHGANLETRNQSQQTALHYATSFNNHHCAAAIFDNGGDVDAYHEDCSVLENAMRNFDTEAEGAEILVAEMLEQSKKRHLDKLLFLAAAYGWDSIVKTLVRLGANVMARNEDGCLYENMFASPSYDGSRNNYQRILLYLAKKGLALTDEQIETAIFGGVPKEIIEQMKSLVKGDRDDETASEYSDATEGSTASKDAGSNVSEKGLFGRNRNHQNTDPAVEAREERRARSASTSS